MEDRYDSLTPPMILASLRSMPRRFAEALELAAPKTAQQVIHLAAEDIGALLAQLAVLDEAVHTTVDHDADPLGADVDAAVADRGRGLPVEDAPTALAEIEVVTSRLADRLDSLSADGWNRSASSPSARYEVTDLARGAVRVAAERLRTTERAVQSAGSD